MFRKMTFVIAFIVLFITSAYSQPIVSYHKFIQENGLVFLKRDVNVNYYGFDKVIVLVTFDSQGNITKTTTGFDEFTANTSDIIKTLTTNYAFLQLQMGKNQVLDSKTLTRKMMYLIDTIKSNLRIANKTKFRYDDMVIYAEREDKMIFIIMM
jgi:hypothetical protein